MKISCVIPIYNEAERITNVLKAVVGHELIDEVIVVNDGSTDDSAAVLKNKVGIKFISYQKNRGKSYAVKCGIEASKNAWIMTIDADLIGLNKNNITELVNPVLNGDADVSISLRSNSLLIFKLFGLDFVSGERVFHKSIIGRLNKLGKLPSFGLEAYLNKKIISKKLRLKVVKWTNVITPRKFVKFGFWHGVKADISMVLQIVSLFKIRSLIRQFFKMCVLKVGFYASLLF
ncbi:MAG: glycosyltransferase family 2 protein [Candidatus Gracilibacteria bacterium]